MKINKIIQRLYVAIIECSLKWT